MKILVTGASGQLGKKISEILSLAHELTLTDAHNMDITDMQSVKNTFNKETPDWVIHAAAYTKVDLAETEVEICRKINSLGTKNIATAAREHNTKMIYISTDFVFDGMKNSPYTEEDEANPISIYGKTKLEGEEFVRQICKEYYIIRVSWLFGELPADGISTNFVETMLRLAKDRPSLNVVADQIGSPTYTGDLVEVISKIINIKPPFGTYHFSGLGACSWYDFAKEIFTQTETNIELKPIPSNAYPQKARRPSYSYLDKSKIEKALNTKARPWQQMLAEYLSSNKKKV